MSYPVKMREHAVEAVRNGHSEAEVNEIYRLGVNMPRVWENLEAETGALGNRPLNRGSKIDHEKSLEHYRENPYSTNKETADAFNHGVPGIRSAKKHNPVC
ncbi:MAG: transposase [Clostridiales bacterium]|jgi:hypothetical protein|nr:transposase [Clostridiales bacterium]